MAMAPPGVGVGRQRPGIEVAVPLEQSPEPCTEIVVAHDVGDQVVEHAVGIELAGDVAVHAQQGAATLGAFFVARHGRQDIEALEVHDRIDQHGDQAGLGAEMIADERGMLAGLAGDGLEGEMREPVALQDTLRRLEDHRCGRREVRRRVFDRDVCLVHPHHS
jgi:hypothetical protein